MSSTESITLSRQPYQDEADDDEDIATLIARIQNERGFKNIDEEILENELGEQQDNSGGIEVDLDVDDPEKKVQGEKKEEDGLQKQQELRQEMINAVSTAHNEAMLALDFISLLVSLQNQESGRSTMSPHLQQIVPVGSLGYTKSVRKIDPKVVEDEAIVAKAWKVEGMNDAAYVLMDASKRLGAEAQKESKYWDQVLAIRKDGWLITRMPREKNVLGVRYGFAEAALDFKDKGIGALRRKDDGSVMMDDVETTGHQQNSLLRVRLMEGDKALGTSVPKQVEKKEEGNVRNTIERARNLIYEEELFSEMMREARTMSSAGVQTDEDIITISLEGDTKIILDMVQPESEDLQKNDTSNSNHLLAEGISVALRILLSYSHRKSLQKRSTVPTPLVSRKPPTPPLALLRPITTHLWHQTVLRSITTILTKTRTFSNTAGLFASFGVNRLHACDSAVITGVESAVDAFMGAMESHCTATLPAGWKLDIYMRTTLATTIYTVSAVHDGVVAKLQGEQKFAASDETHAYIFWCLERAVINYIRLNTAAWEQEAKSSNMITKMGNKIRIEVDDAGLKLKWGETGGRDRGECWNEGATSPGKKLMEVLSELLP